MTIIILAIFQGIASAILIDYMTYLMMKFSFIKRTLLMISPNFISAVLAIIITISFAWNCFKHFITIRSNYDNVVSWS